jgi:uncharacterized protein (TIGR02147 family)
MTFQLFLIKDYRKALRGLVENRRPLDKTISYQGLAEKARIPKSYLSKVLAGTANLSSDQAFVIGTSLFLNSEELEYFLLLVERERCGVKARQIDLDKKIESIQEKHLETKMHIKAKVPVSVEQLALYYLTPWAQIVHMGLMIPRYSREPLLLQKALSLSVVEFRKTLRVLENIELISPEDGGYRVHSIHLHLPRESPQFRTWKMQQDALAMNAQLDERDSKSYSYRVVFSSDEHVRAEARQRFLDFLKGVEELCLTSESEHVYQMRFDLFSWV